MNKKTDPRAGLRSRREFLSTALAAPILTIELPGKLSAPFQPDSISVASPDGKVRFDILLRERSRLSYRVTFKNRAVIDASALGIVIDGVDLCQDAEAGKV